MMLTKTKKVALEKLYYDPKIGFTSAKKLWLNAHKEIPTITQNEVNRYLSTQPAYSLHKQVPKPRTTIWDSWITVSYPGEMVAIDIWFLGVGTKSQFPMALVAVDALSKLADVAPIRILNSKNAAKAMEKIIKNFKFDIRSTFSDHGVEFTGKLFREFMKEQKIEMVYTSGNNPSKTALAESFIRSMRIILGRVVTGGGSGWKAVKQALDIYNNSPHSSLGNKTPNSITMKNSVQILQNVINRRRDILGKKSPMTPPKFQKDDIVHKLEIDKQGAFGKINLPRWSEELYKVYKVKPAQPRPRYQLSNPVNGSTLPGTFPEKSLQLRHHNV